MGNFYEISIEKPGHNFFFCRSVQKPFNKPINDLIYSNMKFEMIKHINWLIHELIMVVNFVCISWLYKLVKSVLTNTVLYDALF